MLYINYMLNQTSESLACPACRAPLQQRADRVQGGRFLDGALECPECAVSIPVVRGFALFPEAQPGGRPDQVATPLTPSADYLSFVHHRHTRRIPDRYAAFQPFNESTRAFYALLDLVRAQLAPGDKILDTWGRTGWSGEMLAAAFPEQHVVSLWEGNFDVLGYAGYAYWLAPERRAPNHDILFVAPGAGLPFLDKQFRLVHGLDSLHRYAPSSFAGEILRIARDDGVILFPHVHLANNQPVPFFERGGWQAHGQAYQERFERAAGRRGRSVLVMSEVTLFNAAGPLRTEPDTGHYNGVVALVPPAWVGAPLRRADLDICLPGSRGVVNPLMRIDYLAGTATPDSAALGGLMEELMLRHPCYAARLAALGEQRLSTLQQQVLFQLAQLRTLAETAARLGVPLEKVTGEAMQLAGRELLQLAPLSIAMSRLQSYYADQVVRPPPAEETFDYLWQLLPSLYGERALLVAGADGSVFGWAEVELLVTTIQRGLRELGVGPGDRVAMLAGPHAEALLLNWAIWRNGSVAVPLRKELADDPAGLAKLLDHIAPALVVVDRPRAPAAALAGCAALMLDDADPDVANASLPSLAALLEEWFEAPADQQSPHQVLPDDPAVIIFTSGSTGEPKGVVLSQRALLQSGQLATTTFGWHDKDTLLSLSESHTMSGLRNPAVAALFAGATVYIPHEAERANVGKTLQAAAVHGITVLATGPSWLAMLDSLPPHLTLHPGALRQILSTGATLQSPLHARLSERMGLDIVDYYGLTETGGLCLVFDHADGAASGRPVGAMAQVCDAHGDPVGAGVAGELRVHSNQLMSGYWRNPAQGAAMLRDAWLYTGDIASHDGRGRLTLVGRRDDQLKNEFGDIVHPAHLERLLASHPLVRDAAIGTGPHGLVSMLVAAPGFAAHELVAFCRLNMPSTPFPRDIREVEALPYTAAGKLDRAVLATSINDERKPT